MTAGKSRSVFALPDSLLRAMRLASFTISTRDVPRNQCPFDHEIDMLKAGMVEPSFRAASPKQSQ